jgi:hypothetical protein
MSDVRWWDHDPDERPIPVGAVAAPVERAAEDIVEQERRALMREDTEPTLQTLASLQAVASQDERRLPSVSATSLGVALLIAGCLVMFLLGWSMGSREPTAGDRSVAEATSMKQVLDSYERSIPGVASEEHKEVSEK